MSMRVMSAGHGYRYLLSSVVCGDGGRDPSTALTDYYTATGTPPGVWLGGALSRLGDGQLQRGDTVTEEHLRRLIGHGHDPVTDVALGRAYQVFGDGARRAVAGYDLTFSAPKSVSALWAVADAATRARIVAAHHAAVADVLALFERRSPRPVWAPRDPTARSRRSRSRGSWRRRSTTTTPAPANPNCTPMLRHEAHCCIPRSAGRDWRRCLWV